MSCRFCNIDGECELFDPEDDVFFNNEDIVTEDGGCLVCDDENPEDSCEYYESDED